MPVQEVLGFVVWRVTYFLPWLLDAGIWRPATPASARHDCRNYLWTVHRVNMK